MGRNIKALNHFYPNADKTAVEISKDSSTILNEKFENLKVINSSILKSELSEDCYDLTFTMGVLIHIHPSNLFNNIQKIVNSSKKYVIIGEYFNREPVSLSYQGEEDKLFKRDLVNLFLNNLVMN